MEELLKNAESYRTILIKPVVDALEAKIDKTLQPVLDKQSTQDSRLVAAETEIKRLQSLWGKVLIGFTVWSTLAGVAMSFLWSKIKIWLHI